MSGAPLIAAYKGPAGQDVLCLAKAGARVMPSMGEPHRYAQEERTAFAQVIEQRLGALDPSLHAESRVLEGPVVDALADIRPEDVDVLVCGSRGYGPTRSVLLGGVSSRLLRHARVPVIVVPRE